MKFSFSRFCSVNFPLFQLNVRNILEHKRASKYSQHHHHHHLPWLPYSCFSCLCHLSYSLSRCMMQIRPRKKSDKSRHCWGFMHIFILQLMSIYFNWDFPLSWTLALSYLSWALMFILSFLTLSRTRLDEKKKYLGLC